MKKIVWSVLAILIVLVGIFLTKHFELFKEQVEKTSSNKVKLVEVATVEMQNSGFVFPVAGILRANKSVIISADVNGKIDNVAVEPAQRVKKGELLITLEHSREQARLKEAQIILQNLERKFALAQALIKKGVISRDSFDQLQSDIDKQKSIVLAKEAELSHYQLIAPMDGVLGLHHISKGQLVRPGTELLQLDDISRVYVDFQIPERFLSNLVVGQEVNAKTDAWSNKVFLGKIEAIDTHVDSDTLSINVRVYFDNADQKLLQGMMIEMRLLMGGENSPVIPVKALNYLGDERFVYVLKKDKTVVRRKVMIGKVNGSTLSIREGLRAGMQVVVGGNEKLHDGDQVEIINQDDNDSLLMNNPLRKKDNQIKKDGN